MTPERRDAFKEYTRRYRAANREKIRAAERRRKILKYRLTSPERIAADKRMIDVIRVDILKLAPLYATEKASTMPVYTEIRGKGMFTRFELS